LNLQLYEVLGFATFEPGQQHGLHIIVIEYQYQFSVLLPLLSYGVLTSGFTRTVSANDHAKQAGSMRLEIICDLKDV
jgi:hypothetical protein